MSPQIEIILQLFLAGALGGLIGLEREYKRKEAGLQTYSLVALGACLFTLASFGVFQSVGAQARVEFDPGRIIQAIAVGIGFVGAGVIFRRPSQIEGLTTAAGLWVTAAIGIAIGIKLYLVAVFCTFLALGILAGLGMVERKFLGGD